MTCETVSALCLTRSHPRMVRSSWVWRALRVPFPLKQRRQGSGYEGKANRIGEFKSPIVKSLWEMRSSERESEEMIAPPTERKPSDSRIVVNYAFSTDPFLRDCYMNPWGFMRKGKLFEDMDALAGNIAFRHCQQEHRAPLLVTASVDRIQLLRNPRVEADLEMSGQVLWTGTSSLQMGLEVRVKGEEQPWVHANFTFVARHPKTGKAVQINKLVPETADEKRAYNEAEMRVKRWKEQVKVSGSRKSGVSLAEKEAMCKLLLEQAKPLVEMPCLADPTCILMDQTRLSNSSIMHAQQRNYLNRIFGGFLMRRAYEIAFATCYLFGGSRPDFREVAHIDFLLPVDVGDFVRFDSCVLYTNQNSSGIPEVHIQVVASICRPEVQQSKVSNTFDFTFALPDKPTVRKVLPGNLDQARRMVDRMTTDKLEGRK